MERSNASSGATPNGSQQKSGQKRPAPSKTPPAATLDRYTDSQQRKSIVVDLLSSEDEAAEKKPPMDKPRSTTTTTATTKAAPPKKKSRLDLEMEAYTPQWKDLVGDMFLNENISFQEIQQIFGRDFAISMRS